ncbi:MAG: YggS family pyridoxal phosphate-dependent enzyme [Anaerolineae bacterium]|nr:YggS family pyridoxal phosphate-dependent enzyme [Anaerolineae bacterium]
MSAQVDLENQIRTNYNRLVGRIGQAAYESGRYPPDIKLVVVTKNHPIETVSAVIDAGAEILGESYADEGVKKINHFSAENSKDQLKWHMIGHVQSRKASLVTKHFALLQSLDSVKLARRLNRFAEEQNLRLPTLIQLNVSGEETKFGIPAWDPSQQPGLMATISQILNCSHLEIQGLMTIPPFLMILNLPDRIFKNFENFVMNFNNNSPKRNGKSFRWA